MVLRYQQGVYNFGRTISDVELFRAKYGQSSIMVGLMSHFFSSSSMQVLIEPLFERDTVCVRTIYEPKNGAVYVSKRINFIVRVA